MTIAGHLFITAPFFWLTSLFYKEDKDRYRESTREFFIDLETPVIADDRQDEYDRQQRNKLGLMVVIMGSGVLSMTAIPNPL